MISLKQHSKLLEMVQRMSELELDSFLKDVKEYALKNKLQHLFNDADLMDDICDLEHSLDELEDERDKLTDKLFDINKLCDDAEDIEEFEDGSFEKIKSIIKEIKSSAL